ncbi:anti-sigma factor family protein [Rhodoferax sp.]|uniref:anti-sigma factor family protein n=1 Tax=Rhodoferax sp. TaxID=50421 RepID=UPI00374DAFB4
MSGDYSEKRTIHEEDLHAYVDNLLGAQRRREVQEYLDQHPEAASDIDAYSGHRKGLRDAFASISDEPVPVSLNLKRLVQEHQQHHGRGTRYRWPWGMAAAVLLSLGLGGGAGWSLRGTVPSGSGTEAGIFALAREATNSYGVYASDKQHPVEMGPAQRAELVSWVSTRLGRKVAIPDLTATGYTFIGGRLVATEHGPAGLFMYDDVNGTRLALMVRPMSIDKNTPMMKHIDGVLSGYAWADQGLGYGVVGAEREETLHPLADEMRRQISRGLTG